MSTKIDDILQELFLIDPALRGEEAALKKTIEELLASRPDGAMDEAFEAELKSRLLSEFSKKARPRRAAYFLARPAFRIGIGMAAAAVVLVAVYVGFGPRAGAREGDGAVPAIAQYAPAKPVPGIATLPAAQPATAPAKAKAEGKATAAQGARAAQTRSPATAAAAGAKDDASRLDQLSAADRTVSPPTPAERESSSQTELRRVESQAPAAAKSAPSPGEEKKAAGSAAAGAPAEAVLANRYNQDFDTEGYDRIVETSFAKAIEEPLSTFSIDVDTASYANIRRFLRSGSLPPPDAVRIEELINYFPYEYAGPASGDEPFAFDTELAACPWNPAHSLLRVALQAKRIGERQMPPSNLVFLIDVSGSMEEENKLPLVKESLKILARRMRQEDRISIVVYAGSAGIVLEPTPGSKTDRILKAIDELEAGGSTAGGEGIALAYAAAKKAFIPKGSNRVILATDGDFNVGASSDGELVRQIEEERKSGVFLSILGFGMGNYKDSKMQKLADSGNGNYAYVDSLAEADKVLSRQMAGTLFTVAKDVKIQIEFNPARVGEYRLIGYEKRALAARDFADDAKDAGELGAGAAVTALYELTPPSGAATRTDLKYQNSTVTGAASAELMTLKFRYKKPGLEANSPDQPSRLVERPITIAQRPLAQASVDFRFAAAVAEWGLILRGSAYKSGATLDQVASLARGALGADGEGYRAEFLSLVELSRRMER